jgi:hypothetical protein
LQTDTQLRDQLIAALRGGHAHATFAKAVKDMPADQMGVRPPGQPHSAWELLEHLRISQNDILEFSRSAEYKSPKWPEGYWPPSVSPKNTKKWAESVSAFEADLKAFIELVQDPAKDLFKPFSWGDGQTLLREALLIIDHNSYHIGALVLVRRTLGIWYE